MFGGANIGGEIRENTTLFHSKNYNLSCDSQLIAPFFPKFEILEKMGLVIIL